jgi:hypothetical protein
MVQFIFLPTHKRELRHPRFLRPPPCVGRETNAPPPLLLLQLLRLLLRRRRLLLLLL